MQDDVIAILDKDAKTVAEYFYDAWGVCTVIKDSVGIATINSFRYRSYYFIDNGYSLGNNELHSSMPAYMASKEQN